MKFKLSKVFSRVARISRNIETLISGNPRRIARFGTGVLEKSIRDLEDFKK